MKSIIYNIDKQYVFISPDLLDNYYNVLGRFNKIDIEKGLNNFNKDKYSFIKDTPISFVINKDILDIYYLPLNKIDITKLSNDVPEYFDFLKYLEEIKVLRKDDDDKDDEITYIVPFTVSYATSIHKSQGLEFDSVKIIISDESEELITKNIFYTAITRAKNYLKIYWSPECQNQVVENMKDYDLKEDLSIINQKLKQFNENL